MALTYINGVLMGKCMYKLTKNRAAELLVIMIFPAALISITEKYQLELVWGRGHIPVLLGEQAQARIDVQRLYNENGYCRDTAMDAVSAGLIDDVGNDDVLFGLSDNIFDYMETEQFYTFAAKRHIHGYESYKLADYLTQHYDTGDMEYAIINPADIYIADTFANSDGGYTITGKLNTAWCCL